MPTDMHVHLDIRLLDHFTAAAQPAIDALLQLAEAGQRAGAAMTLLGDAARVLQRRRAQDRVARRAERRRVTRTIRQQTRERGVLARRRRRLASITVGDAWQRGGGPTFPHTPRSTP